MNYTWGVCAIDVRRWAYANADAMVVAASESCAHQTVMQIESDDVAGAGNARKTDGLDAEGKVISGIG